MQDNIFADLEGLSEDDIRKINLACSLGLITGYGDGTFGMGFRTVRNKISRI